jgi:hypothetical protein
VQLACGSHRHAHALSMTCLSSVAYVCGVLFHIGLDVMGIVLFIYISLG